MKWSLFLLTLLLLCVPLESVSTNKQKNALGQARRAALGQHKNALSSARRAALGQTKSASMPRMFMAASSKQILKNQCHGYGLVASASGHHHGVCNEFALMPQPTCASTGGVCTSYRLVPPREAGYDPSDSYEPKASSGTSPESSTYPPVPPVETPFSSTSAPEMHPGGSGNSPSTTVKPDNASGDNPADKKSDALSPGAIAAIVTGCAAVVGCAGVLLYMKKRQKKREEEMFTQAHHDMEDPSHTGYAAM
ncbi:hypothetical protein DYB32_000536 [Aphanomyces invadans]|uniref:Uncharacterized protein n=1 Tax=Aphanomyces invadans TaxID=157072 RepID=A0A418B9T5_9STRA|nr:hypothetical protein DYB32_000536 [Aphanomyces invadans]